MLESFGEAVYPALSQLAESVGISAKSEREGAERFILAIRKMNSDMGIPEKFDFIKTEDINKMASWACGEANPTYPVPVMWDEAEFASVIEKLRA